MWVFAFFDLPVMEPKQRKAYTRFRKRLISDGFSMMQYSVYIRHCASDENAQVHTKRIETWVPPEGEVRLITVTDKQFERMKIFWGRKQRKPEIPPQQLEFF